MMDKHLMMSAYTDVEVSIDDAIQWFLSLKDNPEHYTFATHQGFYFIEGDFGKTGALFYTKERFYGILLKLTFRLTQITPTSFTFDLVKPVHGIKGKYALERRSDTITTITLSVYAQSNTARQLFKLRPFYIAIKNQISGEVQHVKRSMEQRVPGNLNS